MTVQIDYLRVVSVAEWCSRYDARGGRTRYPGLSPLGGCIVARRGTATIRLLCNLYTRDYDPAACLQPELLQTVHPGLKAEFMYSDIYKKEALMLLNSSKRARDYIAALEPLPMDYLPPYREWRGDDLLEMQALTRAIAATAECLAVLNELGLR